MQAIPFQIKRIALLAGVQTEVYPPMTCQSVTIANGTAGDLRVISQLDGTQYLVVASNFERVIWLPQPTSGQFRRGMIGFWLYADQAGTAILMWA